jgi:3-methyladenine DNA glycosylase AlkC
MAERLKHIFFQPQFVDELGEAIEEVHASFDRETFRSTVFDATWPSLELKERMRRVTTALHKTLPGSFPDALAILKKVADRFEGFDAMVFPDYVECYGVDYFDASMSALEQFTVLCSSEFAVRPFLNRDPERALAYHYRWAESRIEHVRRLASEGCRPRLPWAMALPGFKEDPTPILGILEKLKDDESEFVRRSVANNLNDISKDNPDIALDVLKSWVGQSERLDRVAKHAARTLLKAGETKALTLFGFGDPSHVEVKQLTVDTPRPSMGGQIGFAFTVHVRERTTTLLRLEYAVWYAKSRGKPTRKVFQIREGLYDPGRHEISRKLSLEDLSTRKHYPGEHRIDIVVNGAVKASTQFKLMP